MTMVTISNLPTDLVEYILSRVRLESVRAVRLTCKSWNFLLKSRRFRTMHIGKLAAEAMALRESRMIVIMDYNAYLRSFAVDEKPLTKCLGKLTCLNINAQVKISQVFRCEGLLLCVLKDDCTRLVVWNPYSGQTRWIETTFHHRPNRYKYAIGYENKKHKSCRSYKIMRLMLGYNVFGFGSYLRCYETYDFDTNLWTTRSHELTAPWDIKFCDRGVSLKGNTYWCTRDVAGWIKQTVCFDFTRQRFGVAQDLPFRVGDSQPVVLSCVRDDKLSVLLQSTETFVIEIWITDKIEEEKVSWSKFLRVDMGPLTDLRVSDGRFIFFVDEEKKVAMVFNKDREERLGRVKIFGEDGYFRELDLGEPSDLQKVLPTCVFLSPEFSATQVTTK